MQAAENSNPTSKTSNLTLSPSTKYEVGNKTPVTFNIFANINYQNVGIQFLTPDFESHSLILKDCDNDFIMQSCCPLHLGCEISLVLLSNIRALVLMKMFSNLSQPTFLTDKNLSINLFGKVLVCTGAFVSNWYKIYAQRVGHVWVGWLTGYLEHFSTEIALVKFLNVLLPASDVNELNFSLLSSLISALLLILWWLLYSIYWILTILLLALLYKRFGIHDAVLLSWLESFFDWSFCLCSHQILV